MSAIAIALTAFGLQFVLGCVVISVGLFKVADAILKEKTT